MIQIRNDWFDSSGNLSGGYGGKFDRISRFTKPSPSLTKEKD